MIFTSDSLPSESVVSFTRHSVYERYRPQDTVVSTKCCGGSVYPRHTSSSSKKTHDSQLGETSVFSQKRTMRSTWMIQGIRKRRG